MPEATVKANVAKRRQGIESHSGALGKTNRRILTNAEEDILVDKQPKCAEHLLSMSHRCTTHKSWKCLPTYTYRHP